MALRIFQYGTPSGEGVRSFDMVILRTGTGSVPIAGRTDYGLHGHLPLMASDQIHDLCLLLSVSEQFCSALDNEVSCLCYLFDIKKGIRTFSLLL